MSTLVVDAANVIGSVPDGWWKDRPGAAARLHDHLLASPQSFDVIVLVLEGRARDGVPAGTSGGVTTVHAPRSGDDEIVDRVRALTDAGQKVAVATADRGLIARLTPLGAAIHAARPLHPAHRMSGQPSDP